MSSDKDKTRLIKNNSKCIYKKKSYLFLIFFIARMLHVCFRNFDDGKKISCSKCEQDIRIEIITKNVKFLYFEIKKLFWNDFFFF